MDVRRRRAVHLPAVGLPLAAKLAVLIGVVVVIGMGMVSFDILTRQRALREEQIDDFGTALTHQLAASVVEPLYTDDHLTLEVLVRNFTRLPRIVGASVYDHAGHLLVGAGRGVSGALAGPDGGPSDIRLFTSPVQFKNTRGGSVTVAIRVDSVADAYNRALHALLTTCLLITLAAIGAAWLISRNFSRPITRIIDAATRIDAGEQPALLERRTDELGQLVEAINHMGQGLLRKTQVESLLSRFLAKDVAEEVLTRLDTVNVGGERVQATVLFADIVGFTGMSEELSPEAVAEFLNEYYSYFAMCSRLYFGSIDKFIGDCAMVIFGAPKSDPDHAFHAVSCAVLIQKLIRRLNAIRRDEGRPEVTVRIGVNSGLMLAGVLGTGDRMEYTVVGDSVNLASRLCNEATGNEVIITEPLYRLLAGEGKIVATPLKSIQLRGMKHPAMIYTVGDVGRKYQITMNSLIDDVLGSRIGGP